jgi:agmatine deiminase
LKTGLSGVVDTKPNLRIQTLKCLYLAKKLFGTFMRVPALKVSFTLTGFGNQKQRLHCLPGSGFQSWDQKVPIKMKAGIDKQNNTMKVIFEMLTKVRLAIYLLCLTVVANAQNISNAPQANRLAAEWEPALGTMVVWPLSIPYKLAVELAKDNHLYTIVENDAAKTAASEWYTKWGIAPSTNTFIYAPKGIDSWWVRDWGPGAVFTPEGKMKLADGKYIYSTPITNIQCEDSLYFIYKTQDKQVIKTETDDSATVHLAKGLGLDVLDLPFINTGGNVLTDGLGTAFSTCVLLNENRYYGVKDDDFLQLNKKLLGINAYSILSNFEKRGIQHIDCFMKLLDEERILVMEPPSDHELYPVYESIVENELSQLITPYGRPYEILRIKTARYNEKALAAYTNAIIVNKTIYVPLFQIKEDKVALETWQEAMPGYVVKGFEYALSNEPIVDKQVKDHYKEYGWKDGDALHCRVRAVWDPEMLFMSTRRIQDEVDTKHRNMVHTTIIDYSGKGLVKDKLDLIWRTIGASSWNRVALKQTGSTNIFSAEIPVHKSGAEIEYYVSAVSNSGKKETQPRSAPEGTYQFSIE